MQETIDLGTVENDDTGDKLRVGGQKINANFTELYDMSGSPYNGTRHPVMKQAIKIFGPSEVQMGRLYYLYEVITGYPVGGKFRYTISVGYCQGSIAYLGKCMTYTKDVAALKTGWEMIKLSEYDGSGIEGYLVVNWDVLTDRSERGYEFQSYQDGALYAFCTINAAGGGVTGTVAKLTPLSDSATLDGSQKTNIFNASSSKNATLATADNKGDVEIVNIGTADVVCTPDVGEISIMGYASVLIHAGEILTLRLVTINLGDHDTIMFILVKGVIHLYEA